MSSASSCVYCEKECKTSDSRPYPNSKSKERIHNKCHIKKSLSDKRQPASQTDAVTTTTTITTANAVPSDEASKRTASGGLSMAAMSVIERAAQEEADIQQAANARKLIKLAEDQSKQQIKDGKSGGSQFFFDLKAGVAKASEKRRFLHHRNLCEIATRYDDNGFAEEAVGRAYDHSGKDLNTLGDDSDEEDKESDEGGDDNQVGAHLKRPGDHLGDGGVNTKTIKRKMTEEEEGELKETTDHRRRPSNRVKLDEERNPCWFCLSSPLVEKHLIVAIGNLCYLALAKGGLTDEHLLLIPIEHIDSLNDSKSNSKELLEELESFKKSLVEYFGRKAQGVVFFERNFRSVHWQLQVVPIPLDTIDTIEESIKSISKNHFKNSNYLDVPANCSLGDIIPPGVPYFYWQLEPAGSRFVTQIQVKGSFFPIQFGRLVLGDANILNCPDRVDWKRCTKTKEEYVELVKQIKGQYKEFDFT